ncbi:vacuolar protein sorting-associated protein 75 [[Candida] anglica]|uniref:Vacuolar protein sorting-associated protein 75 n=1 Tax=[Candida] anglica TaxID=148631 RepID=A0ABP0EHA0_9ASCO
MSEEEIKSLETSLVALAGCELLMDQAEKEAEIFRIKKTQGIYEKRREILNKIPTFWYIVLAENDDFAEYIQSDDLKYLECITDIYVSYAAANDESANPRDFSITIAFDGGEDKLIATQTVTKSFQTVVVDGEEKLTSQEVSIQWPSQLEPTNPSAIKKRCKESGKEMTADDKKKYRLGMKSFFAYLSWTGEKPGKEFRHGEDLTRLIVDNLFPYAVKYYSEALPGDEDDDEDEEDSSEGEALDLSDDEDEPEAKRQKK